MTVKLALLCFACLSIGACVGYFTAALCFMARMQDDEADKAQPKESPE